MSIITLDSTHYLAVSKLKKDYPFRDTQISQILASIKPEINTGKLIEALQHKEIGKLLKDGEEQDKNIATRVLLLQSAQNPSLDESTVAIINALIQSKNEKINTDMYPGNLGDQLAYIANE